MKFLKYLLLFLIPALLVAVGIVVYFKVNQKISALKIPNLPSITLNDVIKFSRFSLEKAPSLTLVGSITSMTGEVNYEQRLATESARIDKPVNVQQGEILETGADGSLILNFKDTAEVAMNALTKVNIAQTLPADVVFVQTKGIAGYKKLSAVPVSVRALHLLIENGGEIKVSINDKRPIITVVAINGAAQIAYNNLNNDTRLIGLNEGQTLTFNDGTRRAVIKNN